MPILKVYLLLGEKAPVILQKKKRSKILNTLFWRFKKKKQMKPLSIPQLKQIYSQRKQVANICIYTQFQQEVCGSAGKESASNAGELGQNPRLGRSPGERERLPTPVFWPGEFHGLYSPWGHKELDMTERL